MVESENIITNCIPFPITKKLNKAIQLNVIDHFFLFWKTFPIIISIHHFL